MAPKPLAFCYKATGKLRDSEDIFGRDLNYETGIKVKHLRCKDITRASRTLRVTVADDPLSCYIRRTPDARKVPFQKWRDEQSFALALARWVRYKMALTVHHGASVVAAVPPRSKRTLRSRLDRLFDGLYRTFVQIYSTLFDSPEQHRRMAEFSTKAEIALWSALGERAEDMWLVSSLTTEPNFRRRGYAGALIDAITKQADAEGRGTYLFSSNLENTAFYNAHGFATVAWFEMGDNNPTWKGDPLVIPLMVREWKGLMEKSIL